MLYTLYDIVCAVSYVPYGMCRTVCVVSMERYQILGTVHAVLYVQLLIILYYHLHFSQLTGLTDDLFYDADELLVIRNSTASPPDKILVRNDESSGRKYQLNFHLSM